MASLLGRPLQVDAATLELGRPSVARVLVEIDVSQQMKKRVWIGDEENSGFWQVVEYENWPFFCEFCQKIGHKEAECFRKHPDLKVGSKDSKQVENPAAQQLYVPKTDLNREEMRSNQVDKGKQIAVDDGLFMLRRSLIVMTRGMRLRIR